MPGLKFILSYFALSSHYQALAKQNKQESRFGDILPTISGIFLCPDHSCMNCYGGEQYFLRNIVTILKGNGLNGSYFRTNPECISMRDGTTNDPALRSKVFEITYNKGDEKTITEYYSTIPPYNMAHRDNLNGCSELMKADKKLTKIDYQMEDREKKYLDQYIKREGKYKSDKKVSIVDTDITQFVDKQLERHIEKNGWRLIKMNLQLSSENIIYSEKLKTIFVSIPPNAKIGKYKKEIEGKLSKGAKTSGIKVFEIVKANPCHIRGENLMGFFVEINGKIFLDPTKLSTESLKKLESYISSFSEGEVIELAEQDVLDKATYVSLIRKDSSYKLIPSGKIPEKMRKVIESMGIEIIPINQQQEDYLKSFYITGGVANSVLHSNPLVRTFQELTPEEQVSFVIGSILLKDPDKTIKQLISNIKDINAINPKDTNILDTLLRERASINMIGFIIDSGAKIDPKSLENGYQELYLQYKDSENNNIVHLLATKNKQNITEILSILYDKDPNLFTQKNKEGFDPFDIATKNENSEIVEFYLKKNPKIFYQKLNDAFSHKNEDSDNRESSYKTPKTLLAAIGFSTAAIFLSKKFLNYHQEEENQVVNVSAEKERIANLISEKLFERLNILRIDSPQNHMPGLLNEVTSLVNSLDSIPITKDELILNAMQRDRLGQNNDHYMAGMLTDENDSQFEFFRAIDGIYRRDFPSQRTIAQNPNLDHNAVQRLVKTYYKRYFDAIAVVAQNPNSQIQEANAHQVQQGRQSYYCEIQ